jgi:hypothetical protein
MEIIIASVAILLSFLSFYVARSKVSKRALEEIRSRNSELQNRLEELQKQISHIQDQSTPATPALVQTASTSSEITMLKTELGCIRRDLQANAQRLSIQSQVLEAIKEKLSASESADAKSSEAIQQQINLFSELNQSAQERNPFPSLGTFAGLEPEQPTQPTEDLPLVEEQPPRPPEPYEQAAQQYQDALDRGDRQALRQMQIKELNITSESEDVLLRGSSGQATRLQAVLGGGSYMVISGEGRYWLFPTAQTLESFSMNRPQKGIFNYEYEILSKPLVKKPAEVREEGDSWVAISQGVIAIPG